MAGAIAAGAVIAGCPSKNENADAGANANANANANASADAGADAEGARAAAAADGREIVKGACLSCHSEHMLVQQRLTPAQWTKTVGKMAAWGANLDPKEVEPLVAYLSAMSADAGPYVPETLTASEALAEIAPTPDAPFPAGDVERGRPLFLNKCSGCHGADAHGAIGVALVDKPFLYRAADFATTIRRGRGKMIPQALGDAEIGDLLAYLRTLRNPPLK